MSTPRTYQSLHTLVLRLRDVDLHSKDFVFLFAYNSTGKTRLSMEFKDRGKRRNNGEPDTLYFNAYTEDLFTWDNDLEDDSARMLKLNAESSFFSGLRELALDETIAGYLNRYADFDFDIDYEAWTVTFRKGEVKHIKISRGEENIFVWCLFMAICERVLDSHVSYQWVKYLYIDDPISSLDDNNAILVGCDLANLLRRASSQTNRQGESEPIKVIFSSHHGLFFNVICNELRKQKHKRYFLHRPDQEGVYTLRVTDDAPFFHHVATLAELRKAADSGLLYTYHFNGLRSIFEKTASFFGQKNLSFWMEGKYDVAFYNRATNLLSHGKYSVYEPTEMGEDNKELFRQILTDFLKSFSFDLPAVLAAAPTPRNETS